MRWNLFASRKRCMLAGGVLVTLFGLAVSAWAQKPAPTAAPAPKEDILEEIEPTTPEGEAERDLERIPRKRVEEKAKRELEVALYGVRDVRSSRNITPAHLYPSYLSSAMERLKRALRYFAKVHGLAPDAQAPFPLVEDEPPPNVSKDLWWQFREAQRLERVYEAEKPKPDPKAAPGPIGASTPPDQGGLSRNAKIGIAAAGVGTIVLVGVAAGGGGEETPSVASRPTVQPTPTPTLAPLQPAGIYDLVLVVTADPGGNAASIGMEPSLWINVSVTGSAMQYVCQPGTHIAPGAGTVDLVTGAFVVEDSGLFARRQGVRFRFSGSFTRDGRIGGDFRVGTGGELSGGQATTYRVDGTRRPGGA